MNEKAILVGVFLPTEKKEIYKESFLELKLLTKTVGAAIVEDVIQSRQSIDHKYFIGKGKVYEVKELVIKHNASVVIFNNALTPSQQKNLENALNIQVLDRTGLILDIFAQRAHTQEAKLQVELAQYEYLLPRLTRMWVHLSRQEGRIGTRGPGETQLEVDRRRITSKIKFLKNKIEKVRKHHQVLRKGRKKRGNYLVSLVGYTNAGKSTLLNSLTKSDVLVENMLFATLDPIVRHCHIDGLNNVLLIDTVGFIQRLPHQLVDAFKATLDEIKESDLLLQVIDATAKNVEIHINSVLQTLEEINSIDKNMLLVFNKADSIEEDRRLYLVSLAKRLGCKYFFISALHKTGLDPLLKEISNGYSALEKGQR